MIKKSVFSPRSILIPAVPLLTPAPVSPLLISIILSLTSKFCELIVVVVPPTLRFPVTVKLLTVVAPVIPIDGAIIEIEEPSPNAFNLMILPSGFVPFSAIVSIVTPVKDCTFVKPEP